MEAVKTSRSMEEEARKVDFKVAAFGQLHAAAWCGRLIEEHHVAVV
jgi:hypothetical protein